MDYYKKYLKYKNKYNSLQQLKGGNNKHLILLSEACNNTNTIYIGKLEGDFKSKYRQVIYKIISESRLNVSVNQKFIDTKGFNQDSLIQYFDLSNNKYVNYLNHIGFNQPRSLSFKSINDDYKINLEKAILYFERDYKEQVEKNTVEYSNFIRNIKIEVEKIIKSAKCLLEYNEIIDSNKEYLCSKHLMNYIQLQFHGWLSNYAFIIKDIYSSFELHDSNKEYFDVFPQSKYYFEVNKSIKTHSEFEKGGNFISSPPTPNSIYGAIFCLSPIHELTIDFIDKHVKQKLIQLKCSFIQKKQGFDFRHIDELMTFMPYGKNKFKIWFYNHIYINNEPSSIYYDERLDNLDLICYELYGKSYRDNKDELNNHFVFFDIFLRRNNTFNQPPVMNRLLFEDDDQIMCFFSNTSQNDIVVAEQSKINSFSGINKNVKFFFIDTNIINDNDTGNLHCLIKNSLYYTTKLPIQF